MLKTKIRSLFAVSLIALLSACARPPQPAVELTTNAFANKDVKIGYIYSGPSSKATTHIVGANCLLCYGVASAMTASLDEYLAGNITNTDLEKLSQEVKAEFAKLSPNIQEVSFPTPLEEFKDFDKGVGYAHKDLRDLKQALGVDILVVFKIHGHGAYRSFAEYFPTSDPLGFVSANLYTIDLKTNAYIQYLDIVEKVQPQGDWDEPDFYPNFTTSYYQALENTKQIITDKI